MEDVCRLCCSGAGVTEEIFDENRSTYHKLSTCLPVKVFQDDQLPQKICIRCCCRLDDYYQFCSEAVASQARLRESISVYAPEKLIPDYEQIKDLSLQVKQDDDSTVIKNVFQQSQKPVQRETKCTQTEDFEDTKVSVKIEKPPLQIKSEPEKSIDDDPAFDIADHHYDEDFIPSDYSDDISLKMLKKKKKKHRKEKIKTERLNGDVKKTRKRRRKGLGGDFTNGLLTSNENVPVADNLMVDVKPQDIENNFVPGVSIESTNRIQIKQEWMNISFDSGLLDAVNSEFLDPSMIKTENLLEDAPWYCCVCFVQCPNKNDMITHYRSHVSSEDLKLEPECKLDIVEESKREEEEDGENPSSYKCKLCDKVFNRKYTLEKHALVHEDRSKRPYRCSLCEKTFREVNQILKHGRTHSYEAPQTTPVAECVVPGCPTALKGELCPDRHLVVRPRTHPQPLSKRFVCDLCDEGFVYMRYLIEHRNRTHPEASDRKFVNRCMHCAREFAHLNSLRRHLRSHTGERNFLCNVCGKALSSREHLKFHIRIHTGYKPNVCKTCGKGFVKKCNLTLHERVHSGEKPHVCSHCGKAFSQRSTLVIHERYHSGARPYVCTLCGKGFVAKGLLSMHLKTTCI